jgi:hypothetical protein
MLTEDQVLALTPEQIYALKSHVEIYPPNLEEAKILFRKLSSKWHPDKHEQKQKAKAEEAFQKIKSLYEDAVSQLEQDMWGFGSIIRFELKRETVIQFLYFHQDVSEGFGTRYIGNQNICIVVPDSNADLIDNWLENQFKLNNLPDRSKPSPYPTNFSLTKELCAEKTELKDGSILLHMKKRSEFLCLAHILEKKGAIPAEHVAWILTRLYDLACIMELADTPNADISAKSVFIDPPNHGLILVDGWQHTRSFKEQAITLPNRTLRLCPDIRTKGIFQPTNLLTLIKALARECLGDPIGVAMKKNKDIPLGLASWVNHMPARTVKVEFSNWVQAREKTFGPRKFIKWDLGYKDIY